MEPCAEAPAGSPETLTMRVPVVGGGGGGGGVASPPQVQLANAIKRTETLGLRMLCFCPRYLERNGGQSKTEIEKYGLAFPYVSTVCRKFALKICWPTCC